MTNMEDLPIHIQHHVTRLPQEWVRLLKQVMNVIVCYKYVHGDAPINDYIFVYVVHFEAHISWILY